MSKLKDEAIKQVDELLLMFKHPDFVTNSKLTELIRSAMIIAYAAAVKESPIVLDLMKAAKIAAYCESYFDNDKGELRPSHEMFVKALNEYNDAVKMEA